MSDGTEGMSSERRAEVLKELGMTSMPSARYDDLPRLEDAGHAREQFNFMKAVACTDPLASANFMGQYMPLTIPVDMSIDPRIFKRGWSQSVIIDTSKKIPVNDKVTAATGITSTPKESNWYLWLAQNVLWVFTESGARGCSPVLIFRARGEKVGRRWRVKPLIGALYTLDRTPKYGKTELDMTAQVGLLHPKSHASENKVLPVGVDSRVIAHDPKPDL